MNNEEKRPLAATPSLLHVFLKSAHDRDKVFLVVLWSPLLLSFDFMLPDFYEVLQQ